MYLIKNSIFDEDIHVLVQECLDNHLFIKDWCFEKIFVDYLCNRNRDKNQHLFVLYDDEKPIGCLLTPGIEVRQKIQRLARNTNNNFKKIIELVYDPYNLTGFFIKTEYRKKGLANLLFQNMVDALKLKEEFYPHCILYRIGVKGSEKFFKTLKRKHNFLYFIEGET